MALTALTVWLGLSAGLFLLHWDARTRVAGIVVTVVAAAAALALPFITGEVGPSLAGVGGALFTYGFQGISHERPVWLRRGLYIGGLLLLLAGVGFFTVD